MIDGHVTPDGAETMNARPTVPKRRRKRLQISCTECRKRKQKCVPRKEGPCEHCLRRYPPVECFVQPDGGEEKTVQLGRERRVPVERDGELLVGLAMVSGSGGRFVEPNLGVHCNDSVLPIASGSLGSINVDGGVKDQKGDLKIEDSDEKKPEPGSDPTQPLSTTAEFVLFYTRTERFTYEYRVRQNSPSLQPIGGILAAVNSGLTSVPIDNTARNTELFHFFHQFVVPGMCSIDGRNTPQMFLKEILPWMLQSHIMPHIGLLMASASQSAEQLECAPKKSDETLVIKSRVLGLFNKFLEQDFGVVGNAAIRAIFPLIMTELFWGNMHNLWAHMKGLKQMIRLQGGLAALTDPVLQSALVVTDYQLACCCEQDVYLQTTQEATNRIILIAPTYEAFLQSPLLEYPTKFHADAEILGLSSMAAEILDDVRFLTLSITASSKKSWTAVNTAKIQSTAAWLHTRLESLVLPPLTSASPSTSVLTAIIHLSAVVYSSSISTLSPLSKTFNPALYNQFHILFASIPLTRWKQLPGIFYWILLVACPACQGDGRAKVMRRKMVVTGMAISLEDFAMGIVVVQRFWGVQRWIQGESERVKEEV